MIVMRIAAVAVAAAGVVLVVHFARKEGNYSWLLFVQFYLMILSLLFGGSWFLTGVEMLPPGCWIWQILQRGSLAAIETAAGILGIGNILFGWIYSERNKLILAKTQFELIQSRYANLYTASVIAHFSATILCLLLAKAGAREGAFFSFLTLLWGCIPQAMICYQIAFNQKGSEDIALHLWEKSEMADYKKAAVIMEMTKHLGDAAVYGHDGYHELLFHKIGEWLRLFPEIKNQAQLNTAPMTNDIRRISLQLRMMAEKVPEPEQSHFYGDLFKSVSRYIGGGFFSGFTRTEKLLQAELLCCGYLHYLYTKSGDVRTTSGERQVDTLANQISKLLYYSQDQGMVSVHISAYLQELLEGLEWYMFLTQRVQSPRYSSKRSRKVGVADEIFTAFISSVFDYDDKTELEINAGIAWKRV